MKRKLPFRSGLYLLIGAALTACLDDESNAAPGNGRRVDRSDGIAVASDSARLDGASDVASRDAQLGAESDAVVPDARVADGEPDAVGDCPPPDAAAREIDGSTVFVDLELCAGGTHWFATDLAAGQGLLAIVDATSEAFELSAHGPLGVPLAVGEASRAGLTLRHFASIRSRVLIRVALAGATNARYRLRIALTPAPEHCLAARDEPNDGPDEAYGLAHESRVDARICADDEDWYAVVLPPNRSLSAVAEFAHADGDLELALYGADGEVPLETSETAADEERVGAGPFDASAPLWLRVWGWRGATNAYRLTIRTFGEPADIARAEGAVAYVDRSFDSMGFTGELVERPARRIVVEIVREADGVVVGQAVTDDDGQFAVDYGVHAASTYRVRALARVEVDQYAVEVRDRSPARALYAVVADAADFAVEASEPRPTLIAEAEGFGGAFNIVDVAGLALRLIDAYSDAPAPTLVYRWQLGQSFPCGSCYGGDSISLGGQLDDPDEYDDDIVLHELGHWFIHRFSADDSPGGTHRDRRVPPGLAYGEGVAYFFESMVQGEPDVVDNFIDSARHIDLEAVTHNGEATAALRGTADGTVDGAHREEVVAGIMWDAWDPISDAEPFDTVEIGTDGHMRILVDWFGGDDRPVDVGPRGIDLSDWLGAMVCLFPEVEAPAIELAADREYPWDPRIHVGCDFKGDAAPFGLVAKGGALWLAAAADHRPPGSVDLYTARPGEPVSAPRAFRCDRLPCPVPHKPDSRLQVAVVGRLDGRRFGASWTGAGAADALLGLDTRVRSSSRGPLRETRVRTSTR